MDMETLRESIYLTGRLLAQLQQDRESIPESISGDVLAAYLQGVEQAEAKAKRLRQNLVDLQNALTCAL